MTDCFRPRSPGSPCAPGGSIIRTPSEIPPETPRKCPRAGKGSTPPYRLSDAFQPFGAVRGKWSERPRNRGGHVDERAGADHRADERGLAASGIACLERCLPSSDDGTGAEALRPLWASCGNGKDWAARLVAAGEALEGATPPDAGRAAADRVRDLVHAAPEEFAEEPLRAWSDACSLLALEVHQEYDLPAPDGGEGLERLRTGEAEDAGPLVMGELRRQIAILELLAETEGPAGGGAGLRRALDLSTEGQRVLKAALSRRARGRT